MPNYYYGEAVHNLLVEQQNNLAQAQAELNPAPEEEEFLQMEPKKKAIGLLTLELFHPDIPNQKLVFHMLKHEYEVWKPVFDKIKEMAEQPKPKLEWF